MAVKTITIDLEAYKRLKRAKKENESFSQTIKRIVPKPVDPAEWFARLDKLGPFSREFVDAVEKQVKGRRDPINRRG